MMRPRFSSSPARGVGKTSLACASAVALCDSGKRVLLVSTDPASNVGQVFDTRIGNQVTRIPQVDGLSALEIDPQAAAQAYRERIVGPVRGKLPRAWCAASRSSSPVPAPPRSPPLTSSPAS